MCSWPERKTHNFWNVTPGVRLPLGTHVNSMHTSPALWAHVMCGLPALPLPSAQKKQIDPTMRATHAQKETACPVGRTSPPLLRGASPALTDARQAPTTNDQRWRRQSASPALRGLTTSTTQAHRLPHGTHVMHKAKTKKPTATKYNLCASPAPKGRTSSTKGAPVHRLPRRTHVMHRDWSRTPAPQDTC